MFRYVSSCLLAGLMTSCAIDIPVSPGPFPADTTVMTDPIDGSHETDGGTSVEFDSFVSDSMLRDVQASDAVEIDAAPPVCGDGILSGDEECDDGNTEREGCDEYGMVCRVCDEACTLVDARGPFCGDGIHQTAEECDPTADNLHAQVCRENCEFNRGGGGGGTGSSLTIRVDVEPSVGPDGNPWYADLDLWVFHKNAVVESPLTTLDYVYSRDSVERPTWFINGEINEDNPSSLRLFIDGRTTSIPCMGLNADGLGGRPSETLVFALAARNLSPVEGAEPVVTEATVSFEGNQHQVTFSQPDDFFIIGAGGVCRGAGRVYRRHRRIYNQLQFEPNP